MDELTLRALAAELAPRLVGAIVESVYLLPASGAALRLVRADGPPRSLFVYAGGDGALFLAAGRDGAEGRRVRTAFDGGRVAALTQWGDDRLVVLAVEAEGRELRLVAEFFGRAGNVVVLDGDDIRQVLNGRRAAGAPYPFPPTRNRITIQELTPARVTAYLAAGDAAALSRDVAFIPPFAAAAVLADDEAGATRRLAALRAVVEGGKVAAVAVRLDGRWRPFPCDVFDGFPVAARRPFPDVNGAVAFARRENAGAAAFDAAKRGVLRRLQSRSARLERQRAALARDLRDYDRAEQYRVMGEALKYNLGRVPRGAAEAVLPDPFNPGAEVTVELKAALSPAANVKRLFALYRKAKRGLGIVEARLATLAADAAAGAAALAAAERAEDIGDLEPFLEPGAGRGGPAPREPRLPGRRFLSSDGFVVVVGRSAAENDELTFRWARPHDLWLHAQQAHGSHVVVRRDDKNKPVPRRTVEEAAALAAWFSQAKHAALVPVVAVERRYVRRAKGPAGLATYQGGDMLFVSPAETIKPAPPRGSSPSETG